MVVTTKRVEGDLLTHDRRTLRLLDDNLIKPFALFFSSEDYHYQACDHFIDFYPLSIEENDPLKSNRLVLVYRAVDKKYGARVRSAIWYKEKQSDTFSLFSDGKGKDFLCFP